MVHVLIIKILFGGAEVQDTISLYRKRFIPNEIVHLKDDIILHYEQDLIVTRWNTLKPRPDTARGISAYYIDLGFKVSKIYDKSDMLVYWYCDIINTLRDDNGHSIIFEDLLVDVVVYKDGFIKVLDIGELVQALDENLITPAQLKRALSILDNLLDIIYSDQFHIYQKVIEDME